jgi:hypothetical protein
MANDAVVIVGGYRLLREAMEKMMAESTHAPKWIGRDRIEFDDGSRVTFVPGDRVDRLRGWRPDRVVIFERGDMRVDHEVLLVAETLGPKLSWRSGSRERLSPRA